MKIRICDPSLKNYIGHSYFYNLNTLTLLKKNAPSSKVAIWSHRKFKNDSAIISKSIYRHSPHPLITEYGLLEFASKILFCVLFHPILILDYYRRQRLGFKLEIKPIKKVSTDIIKSRFLLKILSILFPFSLSQYWETKKMIRSDKLQYGDLIFCHAIEGANLLSWAILAIYCSHRGIKLALLFRYSLEAVETPKRKIMLFQYLKLIIARSIINNLSNFQLLKLFSDSEELAKSYSQYFEAHVSYLPIPQFDGFIPSEELNLKDKSFKVGVIGNPRHEKGFDTAVRVVKSILQSKYIDIKFEIQTCEPDKFSKPFVKELEKIQSDRIHLHNKELSPKHYITLFSNLNVLLLPYIPHRYAGRTSGIVSEAVTLGIPIVSSKIPWIEDQLIQRGSGIIVDRFENEQVFIDAIICIYRQRHKFSNNAKTRAASNKLDNEFIKLLLK